MTTIEHVDDIAQRTTRRFLVERRGAGVPCRVTRQGDGIQLQVQHTPAPAALTAALQHDIMTALPADTVVDGELVAFADTVRQPVERVQHVLAQDHAALDDLRWQVWAQALVQLAGEPAAAPTARARRQALVENLQANASLVPVLAEELDGGELCRLGARHGVAYRIEAAESAGEVYTYTPRPAAAPPAAPRAAAYALGSASLQALVQEHEKLQEQLQHEAAQRAGLERELEHHRQQAGEHEALLGLGEETRQRLAREAMTQLRALLVNGLDDTLAQQLQALQQQTLSVGALKRLHADVGRRFCEQFPTQPLARARELTNEHAPGPALDADAFQCPRG